jgi:glutathione S-transferase
MRDPAAPNADITLYFSQASRSYVALWMLEELGVPFRIARVDIRKGEQRSADYLRINPMGKVPSLVDGPVTVSENPAICMYLADRYSYGVLAPRIDDADRGAYLKWMVFSTAVLDVAMSTRQLGEKLPAYHVGWGDYARVVRVLSDALDSREWLLERGFSAADVMLGGVMSSGLYNKLLPENSVLTAYNARLTARPAFQRAAAATFPRG